MKLVEFEIVVDEVEVCGFESKINLNCFMLGK